MKFIEKSAIPDESLVYREKLSELFEDSPLSKDDLMFNLGMYTRTSVLVKYLVVSDLYKRILDITK